MTIDPIRRRSAARSGFTLPEAIMAMVLLGIAAAGVLLPFTSGASAQAEGWHRTLAANLANDLLERIVNTPFQGIVDTWDGYVESQGQVRDASGLVFSDPMYANFSRKVVCGYLWVPEQNPPSAPANFILVTVHVGYQEREVVVLSRLISE